MPDLVDLILTQAADPSREGDLARAVTALAARARALAGRGDRGLVARAERAVAADPGAAFTFDDAGHATLAVASGAWAAGRFEAVSIATLRERCRAMGPPARRVRLFVLDGASPLADIGTLQAAADGRTLFQAASQFNCLESPGPHVTPVANYLHDPTQGPRASVSAFPATLLRHYAAPAADGARFVQQSHGRQVELLADAIGPGAAPDGYLTGATIADRRAAVMALAERFEQVRVGLHDGAEVVLGGNWDGGVDPMPDGSPRRIAQAFTSTVAGGGYGGERHFGTADFAAAATLLLRAAYLGTLLGAATLGRDRVVLTLVGGGVFANPVPLILDAIEWAIGEAEPLLPRPMDLILNGWALGQQVDLDAAVLPRTRRHGGLVCRLVQGGVSICR